MSWGTVSIVKEYGKYLIICDSCDQEHADCAMNVANQAIATVREMLTKGNSKKIGRR